ncbi:MAG: glucose inhibited division protein [Osedax symbiont Rs1]|nr:MAG: glucose inhibited division protein [Osedax symbiont Rs1]
MSDQQFLHRLEKQLAKLGHSFTPQIIQQLLDYHALLIKWNKAYNLTSVRDPIAMIDRHIIDSLSVLSFIDDSGFKNLVDVGSGAGLPGVLLAICRPELAVTSIDSNGKKTRFQNQVKIELALSNLTVIKGRAEDCNTELFEAVISRAFASIADMLKLTDQLCANGGVFLAMKATISKQEISQLPQGYALIASHALKVPDEDGARHLMEIRRV